MASPTLHHRLGRAGCRVFDHDMQATAVTPVVHQAALACNQEEGICVAWGRLPWPECSAHDQAERKAHAYIKQVFTAGSPPPELRRGPANMYQYVPRRVSTAIGGRRSRLSLGSPGSLGPIASSEEQSAADRGSMTARSRKVLTHLEVLPSLLVCCCCEGCQPWPAWQLDASGCSLQLSTSFRACDHAVGGGCLCLADHRTEDRQQAEAAQDVCCDLCLKEPAPCC